MHARVSLFLLRACGACNRPTSALPLDDEENVTCVNYATRWGEYFMRGDGGIMTLDGHGNISMTFNTTA